MNLSKYIDHTYLKPTATKEDIIQLCIEAKEHNFYAVCVNSCYVPLASRHLEDSDVKLVAVVGFPLGSTDMASKQLEAKGAVQKGADEIDMVLNIGMLKSGDYSYVNTEIEQVKKTVGDKILKVILETCYLTKEELIVACQLCVNAGVDFVKTSTGFGTEGANLEDVKLIKEVVSDLTSVKASGGIKTIESARQFIEAGAQRIGTSAGIKMVTSIK